MKKYLIRIFPFILIGIMVNTNLNAQDTTSVVPIESETNKITYQDVVNEKGSPDDLYVRALAWVNSYYPNPTGVTQIRNREDGLITGIARFKIHYIDDEDQQRDGGLVSYSIKLECKEGRYRYTITDYNYRQSSKFPVERWLDKNAASYNPQWDEYIQQLDTFTKSLIADLKAGMVEKVKKDDSW